MIVLDASVVVKLRINGGQANSIGNEFGGRDESFIVPHLLDLEVVSAIRRLVAVDLWPAISSAALPTVRWGETELSKMR